MHAPWCGVEAYMHMHPSDWVRFSSGSDIKGPKGGANLTWNTHSALSAQHIHELYNWSEGERDCIFSSRYLVLIAAPFCVRVRGPDSLKRKALQIHQQVGQ